MESINLNGVDMSVEQAQAEMDHYAEEVNRAEIQISNSKEVSRETASAIVYLRSRSRWTQKKEDELIARDHAGNPIPLTDVLSGEF